MGPYEASEALAYAVSRKQPTWLHGKPGIGKTDIVNQVCEKLGLRMWRFPPTVTLDPVDVRGLPTVENGQTVWARPDLWPSDPDWSGVVFLDELPQGSVAVQSSLMQAVQCRRIGDMKIPDGAIFVAAGNRQEDRAGANRVITPLANRFLHLDVDVDPQQWQLWAVQNGVHSDVRGYLSYRPGNLDTFDPKTDARAFATPRSWVAASRLVEGEGVPEHLLYSLVAGLVGEGPSAEFLAFRQIRKELPDRAEIWKNPRKAPVPTKDPQILYALVTALADDSRTVEDLEPLAIYGLRLPGDFSGVLMRDVYWLNVRVVQTERRVHPKCMRGKMVELCAKHRDVLGM